MNATRFLQYVNQDKSLEAQLNLVGWNTESVVALGAARGYSFSANELQAAIDEAWGTLSEEELRNAAGGHKHHGDGGGDDDDGGSNASSCSFFYGH